MDASRAIKESGSVAGWSDPTDARLEEAVTTVDAIIAGSRPPFGAIERGLALHVAMRREEGADPAKERDGLVMAVSRVMDLDAEVPKARLGSFVAARMISLDMSLQRDAAMLAPLDLLDRDEMMRFREQVARGADWRELHALRGAVSFESEEGLRSLAAGDMSGVSAQLSSAHRASIDAARTPTSSELDARLMRVAGLVTPEVAASMVARIGRRSTPSEIRTVSDAMSLSRSRDRELDGPPPRDGREAGHETGRIARRTVAMISEGSYVHPLREGPPAVVDRVLADASYPDPEHPAGRAARSAGLRLEAAGVADVFSTPQFRSALSRGIGDGDGGHTPRELEERLVADAALQLRAAAVMRQGDLMRSRGSPDEVREALELGRVMGRLVSPLHGALTTTSLRDRDDLASIARGDYSSLSTSTGMSHHVRSMIEQAGDRGRAAERREREVVEHREEKAEGPVSIRAFASPSKGPTVPGSEWIAALAAKGRDDGRS
jgi:hypothetical protein